MLCYYYIVYVTIMLLHYVTCTILSDTCTIIIVVAPYDLMITADSNGELTARPAIVEYGDGLTLNCAASGGPANMFRWFKDDGLLQGNNDNILEITAVRAADGGLYECVVDNTADNNTVNITIYGKSCSSL